MERINFICSDGTRVDIGDGPHEYPLSIDLKITDYCSCECPWCHESSGKFGRHGDPELILEKLRDLPKFTEIAIGGGNPLSHPGLQRIIDGLPGIKNMTIRDVDVMAANIPEGITALGISITPGISPRSYIDKISEYHPVAHLILGINTEVDYRAAKKYFSRVLWLGFKQHGRNITSPLPDLSGIRRVIVSDMYLGGKGISAFDNLAVSQLRLKSALLQKEWDRFFLGEDFTTSMYVDGVKGEFSGSSIMGDRVSWDTITLRDYYVKNNREKGI